MISRVEILDDLDRQDKLVGKTKDTELLRWVVNYLETGSQWKTIAEPKWVSNNRFWYPTVLLKQLIRYETRCT